LKLFGRRQSKGGKGQQESGGQKQFHGGHK